MNKDEEEEELPLSIPTDCWDGWNLTPAEQRDLVQLSFAEFLKPVDKRKTSYELVKAVLGIDYGSVKQKRRKRNVRKP